MSDVIVVMRDGRIQQQGDPTELYERPVNRFVADFIGTLQLHPGDRRGRRRVQPHGDGSERPRPGPARRRSPTRGGRSPPATPSRWPRDRNASRSGRTTAPRPGRRRAGRSSPGASTRGPISATRPEYRVETDAGRRADRPAPERDGRAERPRGRAGRPGDRSVARGRPTSSSLAEEADRRRRHDVEEEHYVADQDRDAFMARMARTKVNRRSFLAAAGLIGGGAALAACTGSTGGTPGARELRTERGAVDRGERGGERRPDRGCLVRHRGRAVHATTGPTTSTRTTWSPSRPSTGSRSSSTTSSPTTRSCSPSWPGRGHRLRHRVPDRRVRPGDGRAGLHPEARLQPDPQLPVHRQVDPRARSGTRTTSTTCPRTSARPGSCTARRSSKEPITSWKEFYDLSTGKYIGQGGARRLHGRRARDAAQDARLLAQLGRPGRARRGAQAAARPRAAHPARSTPTRTRTSWRPRKPS